ncbi:MAG: tail fiber domain-containing protein [Bacteroidetes bacterium]|nr:tail fiber domain-containing protein [Bacteroidota bacterium]
MKRHYQLVLAVVFLCSAVHAQQLGVNTDSPEARFDAVSSNSGILIPRLALTATTDVTTVPTATVSEIVYNTATAGSGSTAVTPGFYYWNGSVWVRVTVGAEAEDADWYDQSTPASPPDDITDNIYTKGNVGIGTTFPDALLTIAHTKADGASLYSDGLHFKRSGDWSHAAIFGQGSTGYNGNLVFSTDGDGVNNTNPTEKMRIQHDGNVGIGNASPGERLVVYRDQNISAEIGRAHIGYVGYNDWGAFSHIDRNSTSGYALMQNGSGRTLLNAEANQSIGLRIGNTQHMTMESTGIIDIEKGVRFDCGSCGSSSTLNGSANWGDLTIQGRVLSASSNLHLSPPGGNYVWINDGYRAAGGSSGDVGIVVESGNVGVGETNPRNSIDLGGVGSIRFPNNEQNQPDLSGISGGDHAVLFYDRWYCNDTEAGYPHFTCANQGEGGLALYDNMGWCGLVSTNNMVHLNAVFRTHGNVSDMRLKENIEKIKVSDVFPKLDQMQSYTYNMIDDPEKLHYGVLAQEIQKVYPDMVHEFNDEGNLAMEYTQLVPILIEAVKELKAENEALKTENSNMKAEFASEIEMIKTILSDNDITIMSTQVK